MSWMTLVGAAWTGALVVALARGRQGPLGRRSAPFAAAALLGLALFAVLRAIAPIEQAAGGLRILDLRYPYGVADVHAFAQALGPVGRAAYARFQLGVDTWAPPAFAGFAASLACGWLPARWARAALVPIGLYLGAGVLANALMPALMLAYPERAWFEGVVALDFAKYTLHLTAWAVIAAGGIARLAKK